jgi:cellulose synthase/poly-beta-1,6-N-acetylglucosamine synthase-like glycosyltransferase
VACLQARLDFYNAFENWLSRQFTLEYAMLFRGILPMLSAAKLPFPLGGTSNHFRTEVLREIGGWDAHNVTEDADIGLRLYRAGWLAETLDSTTYEEAACHWPNWLRQRTRWLKGWMQTYAVHMRAPIGLMRQMGLVAFLTLQGHFAGTIIAALVHPWFYVLLVREIMLGVPFGLVQTWLGTVFWAIASLTMLAGYGASAWLSAKTVGRHRLRRLGFAILTIPLYWLLISVAAYRAVWQLIQAPHRWEKTAHGVTRWSRFSPITPLATGKLPATGGDRSRARGPRRSQPGGGPKMRTAFRPPKAKEFDMA